MANYKIMDGNEEWPAAPYPEVACNQAQKIANRTGRTVILEGGDDGPKEVSPISEQQLGPWK
jgi:hypothetical protein